MKSGKTLSELAAEIERRANAKADFIVQTAAIDMSVVPGPVVPIVPTPEAPRGGELMLTLGRGSPSERHVGINKIAHGQIGEHCGIPTKYYDRMKAEAPELLAANVNRWMHEGEAKRMVRTLDGRARAFLSDRYRPLENEDLANAVLPVLLDMGLDIMSCDITESRLYLKCVDKSVSRELAKVGAKFGDGGHTIVRVLSPALTISNSEVGMGALNVLAGSFDGFCSNLATFGERSMRKYHVGGKHELLGDEVYAMLSDETRRKTDSALWSQLRDVVKAAFDRAKFDALVDKIEGTRAEAIEGDPVKAVSLASKRFGLNETEGKSVLRHLIEGAELSRFGLHNAVTRAAQDVESYDRATELERVGAQVIELAPTEWRELALAA